MPNYRSPGIYVEEVDRGSRPIEGVGTAVAAFIGFTERGPVGEPKLVTNWSQFTTLFGGFVKGSYLAQSVYGYFNNGGGACYITRLPASVDAPPAVPMAALPGRGQSGRPALQMSAKDPNATDVIVEVGAPDEGAPEEQFTLTIRRGVGEPEVFRNVTFGRGRGTSNVVEVVNSQSRLIEITEADTSGTLAERAPAIGTSVALSRQIAISTTELTPATFVGVAADRTGILGYEAYDNVTMVCVPDLMSPLVAGKINDEGVRVIQTAMIDHCSAMQDRVAILDAPPGLSPQGILEWRRDIARYDSKYATLYYPWIQMGDPSGQETSILVPPSGHIAGIWARSDTERGVHKAPANEVVRGAIGLETMISSREQEELNPLGINCIRAFPGRGIRVWGARTLSSDPAWRYINVRRLFNFVEKSIEQGTQWVVFEPNDLDLWERVRRDVSAFLTRAWRDGALFGATPEESFYVKCDAELNTPEERDAGMLIVEIGLAPVKPAEFVVFRLSQYSGGAGLEE